MNRLLVPIVLAAAVLAAVGWLVLGGAAGPSPAPVGPGPARNPAKGKSPKPEDARPPLVEVTIPVDPPAEQPPPEFPPLPPDMWPGDAPPWWVEHDRRLREKTLTLEEDIRSVREIAAFLEKETGVPVRFHETLAAWADENRIAIALREEPARAAAEALAARLNVEAVIDPDGLRFYPRGKAPLGVMAVVSRARWDIEEAVERRAGRRPADVSGEALLRRSVTLRAEKTPLREAIRMLGDEAGVPILTDRALWDANPALTLDLKDRPLSEALERIGKDAACTADATARRIVLLKK